MTSTFKLNSWGVMRLIPQRYSGWAVVTVVFPCSLNRNLQGWSSNKVRALHTRLAVALLVEHPDIQYQHVSVFFFFRECLWVVNVEAHAAQCRMASTIIIPGRILPHTWYRVCPLWTVRCDSCYDELHGILTWKVFSVATLLLLRLANVWCGGMRKHARPAGLSTLLAATPAGLSTVISNVIATWLQFVEPLLRY